MTDKAVKEYAFTIANFAIHAFRCGKLDRYSELYQEIAAKIDAYDEYWKNRQEES